MTFSELREVVGVADSGQVNYHLHNLVGQFVTKADAGYELTTAGVRINGAIEAGAYTTDGAMDPVALETPCPTCGGDRTLQCEADVVRVECDSWLPRSSIASRRACSPTVIARQSRDNPESGRRVSADDIQPARQRVLLAV